MVPNLRGLFLVETLCLEKNEGADIKYHSTVAFSSSTPKIPIKDNFGPIYKKVFFARKITFWQNEGAEVKHDNSFFKF